MFQDFLFHVYLKKKNVRRCLIFMRTLLEMTIDLSCLNSVSLCCRKKNHSTSPKRELVDAFDTHSSHWTPEVHKPEGSLLLWGVIASAYSVTHALTPSLHGGYHIRKEFSILLLSVNENSMTHDTILDLLAACLSPLWCELSPFVSCFSLSFLLKPQCLEQSLACGRCSRNI